MNERLLRKKRLRRERNNMGFRAIIASVKAYGNLLLVALLLRLSIEVFYQMMTIIERPAV